MGPRLLTGCGQANIFLGFDYSRALFAIEEDHVGPETGAVWMGLWWLAQRAWNALGIEAPLIRVLGRVIRQAIAGVVLFVQPSFYGAPVDYREDVAGTLCGPLVRHGVSGL